MANTTPITIANVDAVNDEVYTSPLTRALACWKHGKGISLTLAAELLEEGFDVQALERKHRQ